MIHPKIAARILTIQAKDIMTTKDFLFTPDIGVPNDVYFQGPVVTCQLGAVSYEWNSWDSKEFTTAQSVNLISERARRFRPTVGMWLFIGHASWLPDSRVSRHKGLSTRLASDGRGAFGAQLVRENIVQGAEGIKHLGLICCDKVTPADLASILRSGWQTQFVYAEPQDADAAADALLSADWERTRYELGGLVATVVCQSNLLAFVPTGWFDDRESGGVLIAKQDALSSLYPEISR